MQASPACVIVTDWPATVSVPDRALVPVLAATVKLKVPGPVPAVLPVAVIQLTLELAVQAQELAVLTATEPAPPDAPIDRDVAESVNVQGGGVGVDGLDWHPDNASAHATTSWRERMADPL